MKQRVAPRDSIDVLHADDEELIQLVRLTHATSKEHKEVATKSLDEIGNDASERRDRFLSKMAC